MIRNRFCKILQYLYFEDNRKNYKTDKAFDMRPVVVSLNSKCSAVLSNDNEQSIDKHMVEFKGRSGMKQYIKSKPVKWVFKFWFRCSSKSGSMYQLNIYLGRKQTPEFNLSLGEEIVLQLTEDLEVSFCTVYFDNLFNSSKLIEKLFQKNIYGIGTVRANRKQIPKMIDDEQMKKEDCEFLFPGNTMDCKWMDNRPVLLLSSALEGMNDKLSVQRRERGSSFTITAWVEWILCTSVMPHTVWIKSHQLDFTSAFSLI